MAHDHMCPYAGYSLGPDACRTLPSRKSICELIREVRAEEHNYIISVIEELPCKCEDGGDYCDGHTDAIDAICAIDPEDQDSDYPPSSPDEDARPADPERSTQDAAACLNLIRRRSQIYRELQTTPAALDAKARSTEPLTNAEFSAIEELREIAFLLREQP